MTNSTIRIAVLDDYQNIALKAADWSSLPGDPEIRVFNDHVSDLELLVQRLLPFDVLCIMRERTLMTAALLGRLPNLKLIASTGARNAAIDLEAAKRRAIEVRHTGYRAAPTIEFTWALILAWHETLPSKIFRCATGDGKRRWVPIFTTRPLGSWAWAISVLAWRRSVGLSG